MGSSRQLEWIQQNRGKKDRARQAGTLIEQLARRVQAGDAPARIAAAIGKQVDAEFRNHCRIASIGSGTLVIHVNQASLVCPMRLQWLSPLSKVLSQIPVGRRIGRIIFEFGSAGVGIPELRE